MTKYKARKVVTEDGVFDSKKEYNRFLELKEMERHKSISNLRRQVSFELIPRQLMNGKVIERACTYKADFVYEFMGDTVVEDVKGYRHGTAYNVFAIKRKLMLWIHGIKVLEV